MPTLERSAAPAWKALVSAIVKRSVYTRAVSALIFPLHERLKGHNTLAVRRCMEESQWWSPAELGRLQVTRLRALLTAAQARVPYYRDLFLTCGFKPESVVSVVDLRQVPLLTKPAIRANVERLMAEGATDLSRFNTGGSSGEPLVFFISRERVSHDVAAKWRATRWWDVDIGDREVVVWGSPLELGAQDWARAVRDRLLRTRLLSAFEMSEARVDEFLSTIQAVRPRMLFGYPSALSHIARQARATGRRVDNLGIKVAFVTSEYLYDHQREEIERIFGCRVANGYGGRDAGFIAHACPHGAMHITAEDIIVEIVDGEGKVLPVGEVGEIVVTHLATKDFPFIRYLTGDIGTLSVERCSCRRSLPVLREIQGRTTDFVVGRDGTVIHGLALIYVLRDLPGIEAFKIVQESLEHTRVLIVQGGAALFPGTMEKIRVGLKARLGIDVEITIDRVDSIPTERSGKFRYVESKVGDARGRVGRFGDRTSRGQHTDDEVQACEAKPHRN